MLRKESCEDKKQSKCNNTLGHDKDDYLGKIRNSSIQIVQILRSDRLVEFLYPYVQQILSKYHA